MTPKLKALLQHYGTLSVTMEELGKRPGGSHTSIEEYDRSLGEILPDEPVVLVRVSNDEEIRILDQSQCGGERGIPAQFIPGRVSVFELPEDEFWFFRAFRPAQFDLQNRLPSFLYEMALVNAYAMFEAYLSDLLRMRLRERPELMGSKREIKYDEVLAAESKDALIDLMVERDVRDLTYLSLRAILKTMRGRLGFRSLTEEYDERACALSLLRNCLLHSNGIVDTKLALARPDACEGQQISVSKDELNSAIDVLRKLAYEIDRQFESICG